MIDIKEVMTWLLLIIMAACVVKVTYKLGYIEGYVRCNEDIKQYKEGYE